MRPETTTKTTLHPICSFDTENPQHCLSNISKVSPDGPRRPAIEATFVILLRLFFEVRKNDFKTLLSKFAQVCTGASGRGRGLPEAEILQILKTDPARPAPLKGCGES